MTVPSLKEVLSRPSASFIEAGAALVDAMSEWDDTKAWKLVERHAIDPEIRSRFAQVSPQLMQAVLRHGAGLSANSSTRAIKWIEENKGRWKGILNPEANLWKRVDLSFGTAGGQIAEASARQDRETACALYNAFMARHDAKLAIGAWMEQRSVYATDNYLSLLLPGQRRDCHLGYDLFAPALTPLFAPAGGEIVQAGIINERLDYGGFLVTRHEVESKTSIWALWGHLSHESVRRWSKGDTVFEGKELARMGDFEENGWWLPHLHLQLSTIPFDDFRLMPGVGEYALRPIWRELFPNPQCLVLGD